MQLDIEGNSTPPKKNIKYAHHTIYHAPSASFVLVLE
jgi:hypothetical protein